MSGLDLIRTITSSQVAFIAISTNTEDAINCYELGVVDFLKRSFTNERLLLAINRAFKFINQYYNRYIPTSQPVVQDEKSHFFKIGRNVEHYALDEIAYIEGYGVYCKLHLDKGYEISNIRLLKLSNELEQKGFIRVHKSFIVNTSKIKRIDSKHLSLINEVKIPIGTKYKAALKSFMTSYTTSQKRAKSKHVSIGLSQGINPALV